MAYNREAAAAYAREWALKRNPRYYNFDAIGGDCTNFVSQCLYAGCGVMNYTPTFGWYYNSVNSRAPAWSGVPYLYQFLTGNTKAGPYARELPLKEAQIGDVIQLSFDGNAFGHSVFVIDLDKADVYVAAHTDDQSHRPLRTYSYATCRLLHIDGAREQA